MSNFLSEFLGTMVMILLGNGVVANVVLKGTKGNGGGWIVIATGWALAVFCGVVISGPFSGAHLNPCVTLAQYIAGNMHLKDVPSFIGGQFAGAMAGTTLVWLMHMDHYKITEDPGAKLATFCTGPAIRNPVTNLLSEIVGTFVLLFVIFYITNPAMGPDKVPFGLGSVGAMPVAFLVWAIGLSLGGTTGYALNPARDLGPRIMHAILPVAGKGSSDWGYAWIPVVGPAIGALLAAAVFLLTK